MLSKRILYLPRYTRSYYHFIDPDLNSDSLIPEIKKCYFQKIKNCNPDLGFADEAAKLEREKRILEFQRATEAYRLLTDPVKKRQYDNANINQQKQMSQMIIDKYPDPKNLWGKMLQLFKPRSNNQLEELGYSNNTSNGYNNMIFFDCSCSMYTSTHFEPPRIDLAFKYLQELKSKVNDLEIYGFSTNCVKLDISQFEKGTDLKRVIEPGGTNFFFNILQILRNRNLTERPIKLYLFTDGEIYIDNIEAPKFKRLFLINPLNRIYVTSVGEDNQDLSNFIKSISPDNQLDSMKNFNSDNVKRILDRTVLFLR